MMLLLMTIHSYIYPLSMTDGNDHNHTYNQKNDDEDDADDDANDDD